MTDIVSFPHPGAYDLHRKILSGTEKTSYVAPTEEHLGAHVHHNGWPDVLICHPSNLEAVKKVAEREFPLLAAAPIVLIAGSTVDESAARGLNVRRDMLLVETPEGFAALFQTMNAAQGKDIAAATGSIQPPDVRSEKKGPVAAPSASFQQPHAS